MRTRILLWILARAALFIALTSGCSAPISLPQPTPTRRPTTAPIPTRTPRITSPFPVYGEPVLVAELPPVDAEEGLPYVADLNGDGLPDVFVIRQIFQSKNNYPLEILIHAPLGRFSLATSDIFEGNVPETQNPSQVIVADFNQDGQDDFFIADHGYDLPPHPGFQNILVLTTADGKLMDASSTLPQVSDFTHSACSGDVDADGDLDIYVGNFWGQEGIDPMLLLNDGQGGFPIARRALPPLISLNMNGYTTCELLDVNNDGSLDLLLGDGGDEINNQHSTETSEVLLNDGTGRFALLPGGFPSKDNHRTDIAHDIAPADINGDEFIDLFIVYEKQPQKGSYIQALVNNGDGTFSNQTQSTMDSVPRQVWINRLFMRDIDGDGDLDLLAKPDDYLDPDPILFINNGAGRYTHQPADFGFPYLYFAYLFPGDSGDHDIVYWDLDLWYMGAE